MKILKTFKLFEYNQLYTDEIIAKCNDNISVIKDILLELSDNNYECSVDLLNSSFFPALTNPVIEISIKKDWIFFGHFGPLWETDDEKMDFDSQIIRVLEYAVSEGWSYKCEIVRFRSITNWRYVIILYKKNKK
jgi:hypothetical protein